MRYEPIKLISLLVHVTYVTVLVPGSRELFTIGESALMFERNHIIVKIRYT